jgi:5'-nucleotidase
MVTNDDGVHSPGLHALAECVMDLADVLIVAPADQQTSMSRSKKRGPDSGRIERHRITLNGREIEAYGITGTPAIAVLYGVLAIAPRKPALCLSGINYGENIGYALTTGGTVGAAMEAGAFDIPAIAVSLETPMELNHSSLYPAQDWRASQHSVRQLTQKLLREGMPSDVGILNVNVPSSATEMTPIRWTTQSRLNYYQWQRATSSVNVPEDIDSATLMVKKSIDGAEPGSDVYAVAIERVISVTPLLRNLTARHFLT